MDRDARTPARLAANLDVFDFALTAADLDAIAVLDRGESAARDRLSGRARRCLKQKAPTRPAQLHLWPFAASAPIVVKGSGSRLVIYTVHGADAMEVGLAVDKLCWNPTASNAWAMTVVLWAVLVVQIIPRK